MSNPIHNLNDDDFIRAFEAGDISLADWDHRGHVRYAWIALEVEPRFDRAMDRIRCGLKTHLQMAIEAGENPEFGYHETITRFWLRLVETTRAAGPACAGSSAFCDANPGLLDKTLLGRHYSRQLLMTDAARRGYAEPDLAPVAG